MPAYYDEDHDQWRWRKQIDLPNGKKKRGSGTPLVNNKKAAEAAERDWIAKAEAGKDGQKATESPTLQSLKDDYLKHLEMHRSPSLRSNRESTLRAHLLPWFGKMRLDAITAAEIDEFKAHQLARVGAEKLAGNTVNNHVMSLTNMLRWAKKNRGLLDVLPEVEYLERANEKDVEHLEDAALDAELAKAKGDLHGMMVVAANTGMRAGELLALLWSDVDLENRRIRVKRGTYRGHDRPTKTKKARTIPVTRAVASVLGPLKKEKRGPIVFCEKDGTAIPYATALYRLQAATSVGGWHVLRHTFATRLASRCVPLTAIQQWMGHASIKTTMVYAHYSPVLDSAIHVLDGDEWTPPKSSPKEAAESGSWQAAAKETPSSGKDD